jgi:hypothetical protein
MTNMSFKFCQESLYADRIKVRMEFKMSDFARTERLLNLLYTIQNPGGFS